MPESGDDRFEGSYLYESRKMRCEGRLTSDPTLYLEFSGFEKDLERGGLYFVTTITSGRCAPCVGVLDKDLRTGRYQCEKVGKIEFEVKEISDRPALKALVDRQVQWRRDASEKWLLSSSGSTFGDRMVVVLNRNLSEGQGVTGRYEYRLTSGEFCAGTLSQSHVAPRTVTLRGQPSTENCAPCEVQLFPVDSAIGKAKCQGTKIRDHTLFLSTGSTQPYLALIRFELDKHNAKEPDRVATPESEEQPGADRTDERTEMERVSKLTEHLRSLPGDTIFPGLPRLRFGMDAAAVFAATPDLKWYTQVKRKRYGAVEPRIYPLAEITREFVYFDENRLNGVVVWYDFKTADEASVFREELTKKYAQYLRSVPTLYAKPSGYFFCDLEQRYKVYVDRSSYRVTVSHYDGCPEYFEIASKRDHVAPTLYEKNLDSSTEQGERASCIQSLRYSVGGKPDEGCIGTAVRCERENPSTTVQELTNVCRINITVKCGEKRFELWKGERGSCLNYSVE